MGPRTHQANYIRAPGKIKAGAALLAIGLLAGCAGPRLESAADPSHPEIALAEAGIRLTVLPNAWSGFPSDLSRYFTPLAIRIENQRSDEVLLRLEDFVALDDERNQYRPVPPSEVARALTGDRRFERRPGGAPPSLLAAWPPWWYPYPEGSLLFPDAPYGYYGPPYPPGWSWRTARDILTLALREGRILPGASLQGFVYLQLATSRGSGLTLSWTARAPDGASLASLSARFRIVR